MALPRLPLSWTSTASRWFFRARWALGVLGLVALAAAATLPLGLAAIFWVPLLLLAGGAMCTVWAARRRRQVNEGRDERDVRNAQQAPLPWPTKDITDDRLPEP